MVFLPTVGTLHANSWSNVEQNISMFYTLQAPKNGINKENEKTTLFEHRAA